MRGRFNGPFFIGWRPSSMRSITKCDGALACREQHAATQ